MSTPRSRASLLMFCASAAMAVFAAVVLVATPTVEAQTESTRVAYVNREFLVSLHPAMATVEALVAQARQELGEVDARLSDLDSRMRAGEDVGAQGRELFQVMLTTRSTLHARYESEINAAATPAWAAVDEAIASVARDLDIAIVFDVTGASQSGTIVYADPALDITAAVADVVQN